MFRSYARSAASIAAALAFVAAAGHSSGAQARRTSSFTVGYTDIGPTIGIGGLGNASIALGGRMEHGYKALPDLGNGVLGFEGSVDFYSWSSGAESFRYIPIGFTANYHVRLDDPRLDPFVGAGLGYSIHTCDLGVAGNVCSNSAIYFIGRLGARYFFSPSAAAYADLGAGAATLNLGIMFKLH
jgi:hypothetical protein